MTVSLSNIFVYHRCLFNFKPLCALLYLLPAYLFNSKSITIKCTPFDIALLTAELLSITFFFHLISSYELSDITKSKFFIRHLNYSDAIVVKQAIVLQFGQYSQLE